MNRGAFQWRNGQRPNLSLNGAIYPDDVERFVGQKADILVTDEAPSCMNMGLLKLMAWQGLFRLSVRFMATSMTIAVRSMHCSASNLALTHVLWHYEASRMASAK